MRGLVLKHTQPFNSPLSRVGQKTKLSMLGEYVNKTDKIRRMRTDIRTATEKTEHCLTFHMKYFMPRSFTQNVPSVM